MASVYVKRNKIFITWYDKLAGRTFNRSLRLENTPANMKKAKLFAKNFQAELDKQFEAFISLNLVKETIDKAFQHFLRVNSNKSKKTIEDYKRFQKKFYEYFEPSSPCTFITKNNCENFLIELGKSNYSKNTLYGYTKNLKKFLRFLFEYNYIPQFSLNSDLTYKQEVKPVQIFETEDLRLMLESLKSKNKNFQTAFYILLYTGLRPSDIINITVSDINLEQRILKYYSPKVREYHIVPIHDDLIPILKSRITQVKEGKILEYSTVSDIGKAFRRYLQSLGLHKKGYNLRTFRKNYVSLLYQSGVDLASASKLVGHKKITTTEKYYTKFSIPKLYNELQRLKIPKPTSSEDN